MKQGHKIARKYIEKKTWTNMTDLRENEEKK
jgi:hypothetical protein